MNDLRPPPGTRADQIYRRWIEFHRERPEVYELFKRYTFQVIQAGYVHYSADAVIHRIRWHVHIEKRAKDEFKLNNHYVSYYARLFMREFPEHQIFELRVRTSIRRGAV